MLFFFVGSTKSVLVYANAATQVFTTKDIGGVLFETERWSFLGLFTKQCLYMVMKCSCRGSVIEEEGDVSSIQADYDMNKVRILVRTSLLK